MDKTEFWNKLDALNKQKAELDRSIEEWAKEWGRVCDQYHAEQDREQGEKQ
jgi:hypothetical protein